MLILADMLYFCARGCHISLLDSMLQIKVFLTVDAAKPCFERILTIDDASIDVPYTQLVSSLRFLFGNKCVV